MSQNTFKPIIAQAELVKVNMLQCLMTTVFLYTIFWVGIVTSAPVTQVIKVDSFGYRTQDSKIAIFSADPGNSVEVRDNADNIILTLSGTAIQAKGTDTQQRSGDTVWWVDFSNLSSPGDYHLYSAALNAQSYNFKVADNVYNEVIKTALKTFYLQRCNTPKHQVHVGSAWADAQACHLGDQNTGPASGHTNVGTKDLTGGWHDAGDYNKYVWTAVSGAVLNMLTAYEDNPGVFTDDFNIPESGNGRPDILDEIKWELDWLLKMQLSDGSVLYQTHVAGFSSDSPPSADSNLRYYQNPTLESGSYFLAAWLWLHVFSKMKAIASTRRLYSMLQKTLGPGYKPRTEAKKKSGQSPNYFGPTLT